MRHERSSVCLPVNTVANYVHFSFHLLPPPPTPSYTFLATTSTSNTAAWSTKTKVIERNWLVVLMFSFLSFLPRAGSFIPFLSLSPALRYAFFFCRFYFFTFYRLVFGSSGHFRRSRAIERLRFGSPTFWGIWGSSGASNITNSIRSIPFVHCPSPQATAASISWEVYSLAVDLCLIPHANASWSWPMPVPDHVISRASCRCLTDALAKFSAGKRIPLRMHG